MPRSRLGPLAIETKLGDHPSHSSVWRAIHVQLKRAIAVKIFPAPFGATPEARANFAREWAALQQLQHPAIARCYGGGFEHTDAYLAYELIDGETLAAHLERRTRMSWESVLDMADALAGALQYLHGRDVVYGDLGPSKIIFAGLSPVLLDLRIDRHDSPFRTNRPPTAAEIALRPPESIGGSTQATKQGDLYALGATMYLALTGRPPADGESIEEVSTAVLQQLPPSPASIVMECPIWLDKLVMHLLQKDPAARPPGIAAVQLALAEVRRRSMSHAGVAEHTSTGFSPLNVTDQKARDEARLLLGREAVGQQDDKIPDGTPWHDKPWVLLSGLLLVVGLFAYLLWPLNEDQMRARAEALLADQSRTSLQQAKVAYLEPMLAKYPSGQHATWAQEQLDRVEMLQAEHALDVKLKRNLPLQNEAERLYAEASQFERFGDTATALDQYRSMQTLLGDDPKYRPFVNLARRQIAQLQQDGTSGDEAAQIIQGKLDQADQLMQEGKVVAARQIWYSVVELYGNNDNVAPLVSKAQARLAGSMESNEDGT